MVFKSNKNEYNSSDNKYDFRNVDDFNLNASLNIIEWYIATGDDIEDVDLKLIYNILKDDSIILSQEDQFKLKNDLNVILRFILDNYLNQIPDHYLHDLCSNSNLINQEDVSEVVGEPLVEDVSEVVGEPLVEDVSEVVGEPLVEDVSEVVGEPLVEDVSEVVGEPLVEDVSEVVGEPLVEDVSEVVGEPLVEDVSEVVGEPLVEDVSEVVGEPLVEDVSEVVGEPLVEDVSEVVGEPLVEDVSEVVGEPLVEDVSEVVGEPLVEDVSEVVGEPLVEDVSEVVGEPLVENYQLKNIGTLVDNNSQEIVIKVKNVTMEYKITKEKIDTIKEFVIRTIKRNKVKSTKFTALKNVSFEVPKGDRVGIIGFNGAGKSTLLKILSGVYYPTQGSIETKGKLAPLLELGAGFDHNYSGKANIFLNGAFLGFSEEFLKEKYDDIVEFSELGESINYPVKNYSSGMAAKLGFSIATLVEPDILIIDEILSVGDIKFRKKSFEKLRSLIDSGITVLLVSHSVSSIRDICNKAIWLDNGEIKMMGEVNKVCDAYVEAAENATNEQLRSIDLK